MQSESQHIDEFFRKKEEEWDAGSGDLERDWQHMLVLMPSAAGSADSKPSYYRMLKLAGKLLGGVVTLSVVVAVLVIFSKRRETVAEKTPQKNEAPVAVVSKPPVKEDSVSVIQPVVSVSSRPVKKKLHAFKRNQMQEQTPTSDPAIVTDTFATVADLIKPDAVIMKEFYDAIKKESNEFDIPVDRDTTVEGKEGTLLIIKANTFTDDNGPIKTGSVRIKLTEFYKNDDIVAAKLSTTSNGEQLVTGGMIHLAAEKNGKPVNIMPGRNIQIKMPVKNYDERMQLFAGETRSGMEATRPGSDSDTLDAGFDLDGNLVNWLPAGQSQFVLGRQEKGIGTLDLSVAPYRVRYGNKTVAKFFYRNYLRPDKEELREKLYKQYGTYYDKIILRKARKNETRKSINKKTISFEDALAAGLMSKNDSLNYVKERRHDSLEYVKKLRNYKYYKFSLTTIGWFNCDYFDKTKTTPINFAVNFDEEIIADKWVSHLVFTRLRSMIKGSNNGNQIQFRGIPDNEEVYVVCVGVKNGKMVSAVAPYNTSSRQVKMPVLEETTPEAFRQKLQVLNTPFTPQ
jgi:hypothetical protein